MITFVTGFLNYSGIEQTEDSLPLLKLCACIRQWYTTISTNVSNFREKVELEVWLDDSTRESIEKYYPEVLSQHGECIYFKNLTQFLHEIPVDYKDYWYDSLRFLILGFQLDSKNRIWIDSDTILNVDCVFLGKETLNRIARSSLDQTIVLPWPNEHNYGFRMDDLEVKLVLNYLKLAGIRLSIPIGSHNGEGHVNTGTLFGGDSFYCKIVSREILHLVRYIATNSPNNIMMPHNWNVLEWVSCHYVTELCQNLGIDVDVVGLTHHWTGGCSLPGYIYDEINRHYPRIGSEWKYDSENSKLFTGEVCKQIIKGNVDFNDRKAVIQSFRSFIKDSNQHLI